MSSALTEHQVLTSLDLAVMVAYLGSVWGLGLLVAYRRRNQQGGYLLERRYDWFRIGSSIFATNITPSFLLASAAAGFATGMATANYEWLAWIFLFLLGNVFAPHYLRLRIVTMPEFIRRRFGERAADLLSCYGLVVIVVLWIGGDLFVGGKLLSQILGFPEWQCAIALAVVFTSFTVAGGFAAVMITDTLQSILLIGSMLTLNIIAFRQVGSFGDLVARIPAEHWALFRPATDASYPWPAIVLGYPVLGLWFWCTDQTIVQRMLGARDLRQAQLGVIYTGFLKILPPFLFTLPGLLCLALQPGAQPDRAFLTMVTTYMPVGMMGLVISVLFAASVAGAAGGLNAFSTIFTLEIYRRKFRPGATPQQVKRISQITIVAVAAAAVVAALLMQGSKKNLFDTLQSVIAFFAPPVASVFLLSIAWARLTSAAVNTVLSLGSAVCLTIGVMVLRDWPHAQFWPHFMLLTFYLFVFCVCLAAAVTLLSRRPAAAITWTPSETIAGEIPSAGAGRLGGMLWGILAAGMISLYVWFQHLAHGTAR